MCEQGLPSSTTTHINGDLLQTPHAACIAELSTDAELTTASYEEYATAVKELTACKEQLKVYDKNTAVWSFFFNYSAIIVGENNPFLSSLK